MQASAKKEVSCKALEPIFYYANENTIKIDYLISDIPYTLSYLTDKSNRIEWSVFCIIIENAKKYFSSDQFEEMGANYVKRGGYFTGFLWAFFMFTSNNFIRKIYKKIIRFSGSYFTCLKLEIEFPEVNRIRQIGYIEKGYESCPEIFLVTKGIWEQLGAHIGQKGFKIEMNLSSQKAIYDISWKRENPFTRIKRGILWSLNIRKALLEITESHEELLLNYQKLETSQKTLQKQTTQLKTAHEISTSIRQSLNIEDTVKAIADTLVKEAGFSFVSIQLFKDIDEKNIDIKIQTGKDIESVSSVHQEIIIDWKTIGELIVQTDLEMDYRESNELLEYVTPVINIAIHDALVLRAVTDYKDNLEQKVSERTFELQNARDKLAETIQLLQEAHQTQSRFFTNISHEFRTPLTLILGPAKQLLEQLEDEAAKAKADIIHRSAKNLNRLVDELLDISKIESGEMKLKACPLNLVKIVKESAFSFSSLAERRKITFNIISDDYELIAYVDRNKVDKILSNVLSNAFKFTPEMGKVEVRLNSNEKFANISIADTGIGIPENQIDKIFDRFYQVDGSHTREHEGTGIGLTLTKELVELHKGKIEVESKEGKGSKFKIIFQLGKAHLKPDEICEELCVDDIPTSEPQESIETKDYHKAEIELSEKPSLLIVEDNPDVRKFIGIILENHYQIIEAKDGEEGLDKALECIPDLIISDIMMPKMDGFQVCSKLKTDSRTSHIPIIMLTAKATMNDKIAGLKIGADDYIMKPFEAVELKARIKNLLEQRKRIQEHFRKYGLAESAEVREENNITHVDRKFLQKVDQIISSRISDTSFGVEILAADMAVSRSLLFKKINTLVGEPPSELIKRTRLNRAAKLIENNSGNISEIALEVGFNNPSYFAECFRKQFGTVPSQYHNKSNNS